VGNFGNTGPWFDADQCAGVAAILVSSGWASWIDECHTVG
jgi:hypothetical protein